MNLVPLSLATRHVYLCVQDYAPQARPEDRFNRLGRLMASLGGLYVMEGPDGAPRPLSKDELAAGFLRHGSANLDLRVTHECIEKAIDTLRGPSRA